MIGNENERKLDYNDVRRNNPFGLVVEICHLDMAKQLLRS